MSFVKVIIAILMVALVAQLTKSEPVNQQVIFPPSAFDNATQWGIGIGATPTHDACYIIGYNWTDGRAFAQYYQEDLLTRNMTAVGNHVYGDVMGGLDATEMNPAGALLTTDKQSFIWSISTVNNSGTAYGYAYFDHLEDGEWVRKHTFLDPIPGASRLYGGALAGINNGSIFLIGAAAYPVSGPGNTIPSTVEVWSLNNTGGYELEHTLSLLENRTGLYGYSLDISQDGRWIAVGAWNFRPRSVFLYDRYNDYELVAQLAPFGNVTRFGYSISFSPDAEWLIVGVFQFPTTGFDGATVAYRFNSTLDEWDVDNYYLLSIEVNVGVDSPGQGSSVSISGPYEAPDNTTAWSLVYGMPYLDVNSTEIGGVSLWTFNHSVSNWTEIPPPLFGFGELAGSMIFSEPSVTNNSNWRYALMDIENPEEVLFDIMESANPFLDLGWPSTPNRMISHDACSVIVPGISNIGLSTGFVFRWINATEGCPRDIPHPVEPPIEPPVSPPTALPVASPIAPPTASPVIPPTASPTPVEPPTQEPLVPTPIPPETSTPAIIENNKIAISINTAALGAAVLAISIAAAVYYVQPWGASAASLSM
jgi:hypothetical protein